ncbi:hypothetical protein SAMN02745244_01459 [Tessaracoccus bendigoensis DSM 12906]|uniref:Uncharacterized protein n=1 Tax=Tessaracoccus bendigoensis DSM 12906 TaxID=1123357 RepID=A0A1M6FKJ5_9ACTN|nr:HAD family hydrolase [Tessaracoccus bendigoensis]SHI98162.1 hypothetical protein SAMN02745244_01459 [Tessaracoccus bendigoensis DSM 12906]
MKRAIFLDFDGTLAHLGEVPPAHVEVVRAARAAGNAVMLCTGRPKSMLPARRLVAGFDGIVASGGGYVEVAGEVLSDRRFPAAVATRAVRTLTRHRVAFLLEAPDALYGLPGIDAVMAARLGAGRLAHEEGDGGGPRDVLERLEMSEDLLHTSFSKISFFDSPVSGELLIEQIGPEVALLPSSISGLGGSAGEIHLADVHKGIGMRVAAAYLGVAPEDVVAFGDGVNDVEMLEEAGIGVAIKGSDPLVLAAADRFAEGPENDGLVAAFEELGLV